MRQLFTTIAMSLGLGLSAFTSALQAQTLPMPDEEPVAAPPVATPPISTKKKASKHTKAEKSKWTSTLGLEHTANFHNDALPTSVAIISIGYTPTAKHSLGIVQGFVKHYEVDPGEKDVKPEDTSLIYSYKLSEEIVKTSINFQTTIPISEYSRQNNLITKSTLRFDPSKSFWGDVLTLKAGVGYSLYVNEYKTSPASQKDGGDPLPLDVYGGFLGIDVKPTKIWTIGFGGSYDRLRYEDTKYTNEADLSKTTPVDHAYGFGLATSLQASEYLSIGLGVQQTNRVERYGSVEVLLYDAEVTQWVAGVEITW